MQLDPGDDEAEQRARMEIENRAREDIRRALEAQREEIRQRVAGRTFQDFTDLDLTPSEDELRYALQQALAKAADLGISIAIRQFEGVGLAFDWTLANTQAREWALEHTGELIGQINDTTMRRVQASVAAWIDSGAPLQDLIDDLAPLFGAERADLIASTEVTRAFWVGNMEAFRVSGVVETVEHRTASDERVCPLCGPLNGVRTSLSNPSMSHPSGSEYHELPIHPRCRCWWVAVIDD